MIVIPQVKNKIYGVVGLGKSGRATVASLLASGAEVIAWDDGEAGREAAAKEFPNILFEPVEKWNFSTIAALVMSPGIMLTHAAVIAAEQNHIEVIGDIELLYRAQPNARYIGITGTNGKSTTTTLIAHILQACGKRVEVGGNLGTPALALAPLDTEGIYVLELSSYQLDLVRTTRFNTAVLLNISPDHLDHHGTMEHYIAVKMHIFDRQAEDDVAIAGVDDAASEAICRQLIKESRQRIIPVAAANAIAHGIDAAGGTIYNKSQSVKLTGDISGIKSLQGEHNWQNAAAAYAACFAHGCTHEDIIRAMQTYSGLAHRMEWLGEIGGVQFVNDSKATNADAAEKALKTYDDIYWILGGVAKEGGIEPLVKYFPKIRHAYLIGEAANDFAETFEGNVNYTHCGTLENAFYAASQQAKNAAPNTATKNAKNMPCILLSPACASFDQFPNFEARGAAFAKLFNALKAGIHAA